MNSYVVLSRVAAQIPSTWLPVTVLTWIGIVQEFYVVVALPGVLRPMALGFKSDKIRRSLTIEEWPAISG
jgi:hypothetical protein